MNKRKLAQTGSMPFDKYGRGSAAANGAGFVDLAPGDTFDGLEAQLRARISEVYVNQTLGISAYIGSNRNANELAKHLAFGEGEEDHKFAAKNVGVLFRNGQTGIRHFDTKAIRDDSPKPVILRVFSRFVFGGVPCLATITLREETAGSKLYAVQAVDITKDADSERTPRGETAPLQNLTSFLACRIAYYVGDVNRTRPEFIGLSEAFTIQAAVTRLLAILEDGQQDVPNLCPAVQCTGCAACHDACAKGAISMIPDKEGFVHPQIDATKCVRCGRCEQVCPVLRPHAAREPLAVYAAKAKDDELRLQSSSGGIFSLLARQIIKQGGIVFGAGWDKSVWRVVHKSAENELDLDELRGSKYVQSDTRGIYRRVKEELTTGRPVLFSGTPCQIAALRSFLRREYDNLILVDVICHAVPSPLVWKKYLDEKAAALAGGGDSASGAIRNIRRISFRCKVCGWKRFSLSLTFANDKEYHQTFDVDPFLKGFLNELYNRPSCSSCTFKAGRSGADITIGDYWGVAKAHRGFDDDKGTSVILVNTPKGRIAIDEVSEDLSLVQSKAKYLQRLNPALTTSVTPTARQKMRRAEFFACLAKGNFDSLVVRLTYHPLWRKVLSFAKRSVLRLPKKIEERIFFR